MLKEIAEHADRSNSAWDEGGPMHDILGAIRDASEELLELRQFDAGRKTESPIECVMYCALASRAEQNGFTFSNVDSGGAATLETQKVIGQYRVDFLVCYGAAKIVVECDGHDFHEKTKEQAARDKSRDRDLQSMGYMVFRFTGSEIWRRPVFCADQVFWALIGTIFRGNHG